MPGVEPPPIEDHAAPVFAALGRAIVVFTSLERLLLLELAQQRAHDEGISDELGTALLELERKPAGRLLEVLRGRVSDAMVARILEAIGRRNRIVHHFLEEPGATMALVTHGRRGRRRRSHHLGRQPANGRVQVPDGRQRPRPM